MIRIKCEATGCCREAEYECTECRARVCDSHCLVSSKDSEALCPDCDEIFRGGLEED